MLFYISFSICNVEINC